MNSKFCFFFSFWGWKEFIAFFYFLFCWKSSSPFLLLEQIGQWHSCQSDSEDFRLWHLQLQVSCPIGFLQIIMLLISFYKCNWWSLLHSVCLIIYFLLKMLFQVDGKCKLKGPLTNMNLRWSGIAVVRPSCEAQQIWEIKERYCFQMFHVSLSPDVFTSTTWTLHFNKKLQQILHIYLK